MRQNQKSASASSEQGRGGASQTRGLTAGLVVLTVLAGIIVARGGRIASINAAFPGLPSTAIPAPRDADREAEGASDPTAADPDDPDEIIAIGPVA